MSVGKLTGPKKAAILLLALGEDAAAEVMKNLEEGGRISEESQGLTNRRQGASDMFEVSERLSEVV